jgi:hypothetical protein
MSARDLSRVSLSGRVPAARERHILRCLGEVLIAAPLFLFAPPFRRRHLRWGATDAEVAASMRGDELVPKSSFTATRAVTIDAAPESVWPWLVQIGYGRAGWYSYDLFDNAARPSADWILPQYQEPKVGDWVPMSSTVNDTTAFRVAALESNRWMLWSKPGSSWVWTLTALEGGRTRLVTRVKARYAWRDFPGNALLSLVLMEVGDFAMMRKLLLNVKQRAEHLAAERASTSDAAVGADDAGMATGLAAWVDLYWLPLGAGGHSVRLNGRVFESVAARLQRRRPCDLYHAALEVQVPEGRFVIEQAPAGRGDGSERGVLSGGAVGSRLAGRIRIFRYELRRWRGGTIPDVAQAVESPRRLTDDEGLARRVLELVPAVPTPVWGRDELNAGEMWNSNSVVAWLLERSGLGPEYIAPPAGGRAPGWRAGIVVARHKTTLDEGGSHVRRCRTKIAHRTHSPA